MTFPLLRFVSMACLLFHIANAFFVHVLFHRLMVELYCSKTIGIPEHLSKTLRKIGKTERKG